MSAVWLGVGLGVGAVVMAAVAAVVAVMLRKRRAPAYSSQARARLMVGAEMTSGTWAEL